MVEGDEVTDERVVRLQRNEECCKQARCCIAKETDVSRVCSRKSVRHNKEQCRKENDTI